MIRPTVLAAALLGLPFVPAAGQLSPGDTPVLVLTDGASLTAPTGSPPFDNSAQLGVPAGAALSAEVEYLAHAPPNSDVLWGVLLSSQQTPLPTNLLPPPLFTMPPFLVMLGSSPTLDAFGTGSLSLTVPAGLYEGTMYVQAIVQDLSAPVGEALRLTNGVRVDVEPPDFNVRLSYVRATPALGVPDLSGVGHADLDAELMTELPPFGTAVPPFTSDDPVGLPQGFRFLHVVPNAPDGGPVNHLARPVTRIAANVGASQEDNLFEVEDTTFFPPSGKIVTSFQFRDPYGPKTSGNTKPPKVEVCSYFGKTGDTFFGLKRKDLGSTGSAAYTHLVGELVVGEYTMATTSGALTRQRVGLDARNPDMVHVVVPAFSFTPPADPGAGEVTMDLDLYRFEDSTTGEQGFCVLDRATQQWRVIGNTLVDTSDGTREWNPMVAIAPDGRCMIASVRVEDGEFFDSDADELWAIRLDGLDWPVSGSEAWQIDYQTGDDPVLDDTDVRARGIYMPSVAIIGPDSENLVAFVGLSHKFAQSDQGDNVSPPGATTAPINGFEAEYLLDEHIVRDYIDVPLVAPGSGDADPVMPRAWINDDFGDTGSGAAVVHYDPFPFRAKDGRSLYLAAGFSALAISPPADEDLFRIANVAITSAGQAGYSLRNLTGHGTGGAPAGNIRPFLAGGHGIGGKVALSPLGTRVAFVFQDGTKSNRDWLHIADTDGSDFALVDDIYKDPGNDNFREEGPYVGDHVISGLQWIDENRVAFLQGRGLYTNPVGWDSNSNLDVIDPNFEPAFDVFIYDVTTDTMVNVTNTGGSPDGFGQLGTIRPAAVFGSPNGEFLYIVRDGLPTQGNTVLDPGVEVMNVLAVDLVGQTAFDITGDELGTLADIPNLDLPAVDCITPIETLAAMNFIEGTGVQEGLMFFTAHRADDTSGSDTLVAFNADAPFLGLTVAPPSGSGTHISNVTPSPYEAAVAFARTTTADPLSVTQHAFVADFSAFGFVRNLTPDLVDGNGDPAGRVMDASFQFIEPGPGFGSALAFVIGLDADEASGVARQTATLYYPMENVSNLLLEPKALLLPLLSTSDLGANNRVYLQAASLSTGEP